MTDIKDLKPKLLWKHFDEIRKIPHCSKHEEKIRQYIINFAKTQKLKYIEDKNGNIVIIKNPSPGYEKKPTIILQGHMDMVCEKNSDIKHDFFKDPIKIKIKEDILTADGTTLGADNGIGVAASLAILEDKNLDLGCIEALFTVDEETGLTGAFSLENTMLKGKKMLNLDSEDFGVITVGCAGGGESEIKLPIKNGAKGRTFNPFAPINSRLGSVPPFGNGPYRLSGLKLIGPYASQQSTVELVHVCLRSLILVGFIKLYPRPCNDNGSVSYHQVGLQDGFSHLIWIIRLCPFNGIN